MTGGRLKRVADHIKNEEAFYFAYGDGVSNVNIASLIEFHKNQKTDATLTAVYPPGRFGALDIAGCKIKSFKEKPRGDGGMINGGFFVLSPKVLDLLGDDSTVWEQEPLETLAKLGQISAFEHSGFCQPMNTLRDKNYLEVLWQSNYSA